MFWKRRKALEQFVGFECDDDYYFNTMDSVDFRIKLLERQLMWERRRINNLISHLGLEDTYTEAKRGFKKKSVKK